MNETPVGRLKRALIETLTDAVENGFKVLNKDGEVETINCPASVLAVAAKVVKDFHEEGGMTASEEELNRLGALYRAKRGNEKRAH